MNPSDVLPSALAILAFGTPEKTELVSILSENALAALEEAQHHGFISPIGRATIQTGTLYARMNEQFAAIMVFMQQKRIGSAYADAWRAATASEPPSPSTLAMAGGLASAVLSEAVAIARGDPAVTQKQLAERKAVCLACPWISDPQDIENAVCSRCRCKLKHKTKWRSQKCPVGNW